MAVQAGMPRLLFNSRDIENIMQGSRERKCRCVRRLAFKKSHYKQPSSEY